MGADHAQQFVDTMREDKAFRKAAREASDRQTLTAFLLDNGYKFELHDLVIAMAGCMDQMTQQFDATHQE